MNHFNIFKNILPPHSLINTLLLEQSHLCPTTCIETGPFLVRPPALDPCHRQRQLIAVSSSDASTWHVAAAAAVFASSSTTARPLLVRLREPRAAVRLSSISSLAHRQPVGMSLRQQRSCRVSLTATTRTSCQSAEASAASSWAALA